MTCKCTCAPITLCFWWDLLKWTLNYECSVGQPLVTRLFTALNTRPESVYYDWSNCKSTTPNVNQQPLFQWRSVEGQSMWTLRPSRMNALQQHLTMYIDLRTHISSNILCHWRTNWMYAKSSYMYNILGLLVYSRSSTFISYVPLRSARAFMYQVLLGHWT